MNVQETKTELPDTEACWYYTPDNKRKLGPFTREALRHLLSAEQPGLSEKSLVWRLGSPPFPAPNFLVEESTDEDEADVEVEAEESSDDAQPHAQELSFSPVFYSDLQSVYAKLDIDPRRNLPKLAEWFEARKVGIRERMSQFCRDLVNVTDSALLDPGRNLNRLEKSLSAWRAWAVAELRSHMNEVPADDPLRCSISLFGTMDHGRLERAHTNTLAWFLHPMEIHRFGPLLVEALFHRMEGSESSIKVNYAKAEQEADGERLDVFVDGSIVDETGTQRWCMMIEAKVDAKESEDQLCEYDRWIKKRDYERITRIFLTPDGRPAETSDEDEWKPLSFLELAGIFRTALFTLDKTGEGYHFLRYYLTGILKDICRWQLPINPEKTPDPYGFLAYVREVSKSTQKGAR